MIDESCGDLGALSRVTSEKVLAALRLVTTGTVVSLSQVLHANSPQQPTREFRMEMNLSRLPRPDLRNSDFSSVEETLHISTHSGTHLDGLAHTGIGNRAYNGKLYSAIATPDGLTELGIEQVPPFVTRGIFLDVAAGRPHAFGRGDAVSVLELMACVDRAGIEFSSGDAVIIRTGWGDQWDVDASSYTDGEPGVGVEAAHWLTDQEVCMIGVDNWGVEAVPMEYPGQDYPVHQHCLTECGCYLLENVRTKELEAAGVTAFCLVLAPLSIAGASASMVNPVALF